jgi:hypothetical protein
MAEDKLSKAIAESQRLHDAGEGGWPCGMMLFVGVLAFLAFVVLPVALGMGG